MTRPDATRLPRHRGRSRPRRVPATAKGVHAPASVRRLVIIGVQVGFDFSTLPALARLAAGHGPDHLVLLIGPPSRRSRPATGGVSGGVDEALAVLRYSYKGPIDLQLPSETDAASASWNAPNPDRLRRLAVRLLPPHCEIAPGWMCTSAPATSTGTRYPGLIAIGLARRTGTCVVLGGTDHPGLIGETTLTSKETPHTLWGLEVASLPGGVPKLNQPLKAGLGILDVHPNGRASPALAAVPKAVFRRKPESDRLDPL